MHDGCITKKDSENLPSKKRASCVRTSVVQTSRMKVNITLSILEDEYNSNSNCAKINSAQKPNSDLSVHADCQQIKIIVQLLDKYYY